jgi:hypothetical protein|tara:strand:- start:748 stop:1095 length:348 start_codon:yes stop_codon:yes gene_type:complete
MPSLGKNIAIGQPKGPSARIAEAKYVGTLGTFGAKQNSTVNSKFDSSTGMGNSDGNRKLQASVMPNVTKQNLTNLTRHQKNNGARSSSQLNVEGNLGSMGRIARLKAQAIKNSRA